MNFCLPIIGEPPSDIGGSQRNNRASFSTLVYACLLMTPTSRSTASGTPGAPGLSGKREIFLENYF